jgi:carbamate kinase
MGIGIHDARLVSLISYVVVGLADPAFDRPTKPIGPVYDRRLAGTLTFPVVETAEGLRRVVASPEPVSIVEKREILELIDRDFIVICCGGGGIPVVRKHRAFAGVDAVIDKDRVSALLAEEIGAEVFVIATDVPGVAVGFGTREQRFLEEVTTEELREQLEAESLGSGSMAPKIEAVVRFAEGPAGRAGGRAAIASLESLEEAVAGRAGTRVAARA